MNLLKPRTLLLLSIVLLIGQQIEARRKIIKGRRTIIRTYYREPALPGWAVVLLVGLGESIFGALLYFILRVLMIDRSVKPRYSQYVQAPRSTTP